MMKDLYEKALPYVCLVTMTLALYGAFLYAPTERTMGDVQRIFYFHISAWWVSGIAYTVTFVASLLFLWSRSRKADRVAVASAEIGVLFTTVGLVTGPIWAKPVWGVYWTWDARLSTALVLWLMFVGYLMLRRYVPEEGKRGTLSAVAAIIAWVDVPIVYLTIHLFRTQHPQPVIGGGEDAGLHPLMTHAFLMALTAFFFFYLWLVHQRLSILTLEDEVDGLHKELEPA
jgi:heme exporter protein C